MANQQGQTVWRWDQQEPFGVSVPDENPSGLGAFEFGLRFPGQYFDRETGLHHNYFRDYDAGTGRYVQSDPIGSRGGLNTYAYVEGNPLSYTDPWGLFEDFPPRRPPSFFELTTTQALRRDTPLEEALARGEGVRNFTAPAIVLSLSPYAAALAGQAGLVACRAAPEALPKLLEACKNPLLAATLGASICGSTSGALDRSAREFVRTRERLQEIREASERAQRVSGAKQIAR